MVALADDDLLLTVALVGDDPLPMVALAGGKLLFSS